MLADDILQRLCPLLPEGLFHNDFFRCVHVLLATALFSLWTILAVLTAIPCPGHRNTVLYLCGYFSAMQLSSLGTDKAVLFFVIRHVLNAADLRSVLLRFLCFIVGRLYETHLPVGFQIEIIIQAFIAGIRSYFLIPLLMCHLQLVHKGDKGSYIGTIREYVNAGNIFAVHCNLHIIGRFQLTVSHAQAFYGVLTALFDDAQVDDITPDFAAEIAEEITAIIAKHSQIDWTNNQTIHDRISQDIDDLFYEYEKNRNLILDFDIIDKIIENVKTVALRRF